MAFSQPMQQNGVREVPRHKDQARVPNGTRKHRHDDEEQGKLFVGGLSWDTSQDSLLRYFSRFGEVIDCVVMKNAETGRSRGFGFVTFNDPANVDAVLASCPHSLDGRTIDPKACNPRSMQKPKRTTYLPKVFLGGLPSSITETDLRGFFSKYGEVCEVVIMYDQEKKKSRGFGFLSFGDEASCCRAVSEHFVTLQNRKVEIKRAEPRINHNSELKEFWATSNATNGQIMATNQPPPQQSVPQVPPPPAAYWSGPPPPQGSTPGPMPPPPPPMHSQPPPSASTYHYGAQVPPPAAVTPQLSVPGAPPPQAAPQGWAQPAQGQWQAPYATPPPVAVQPQFHSISPSASQPQFWPGQAPPPVEATPPPVDPYQQGKFTQYAAPVKPYVSQSMPVTSVPVYAAQQYPVQAGAMGHPPPVSVILQPRYGTQTSTEYYPTAAVSPAYNQAIASTPEQQMNGGLGPQRVAMFAQPSSQVQGYHPYRRS